VKYIQDVLLFYRQKIESAQKPSGHVNKPITVPLGGSGKMYGIVSVPEHCLRCKYTESTTEFVKANLVLGTLLLF
jgi:hypothetical protein